MTVGQLAGRIAAIAFVGLVFAVIWFLVQTAHAMKQAVASLDGLAKEATTLSHQADKILQNTDELLTDINQKSAELDPAFSAIGAVGQSVSDLNEASRQLVNHVAEKRAKRNKWTTKLGEAALAGLVSRLTKRKN